MTAVLKSYEKAHFLIRNFRDVKFGKLGTANTELLFLKILKTHVLFNITGKVQKYLELILSQLLQVCNL